MTKTTFLILLLLVSHLGSSQIRKLFSGTVLCDGIPVQGVDVIDLTSEKATVTNGNGEFSILATPNDRLSFYSKGYDYKTMVLTKEAIEKKGNVIQLKRKTEELKEVVVKKQSFGKLGPTYNEMVRARINKEAERPKNTFVNDGSITNGIDFWQIGKMIYNIFKRKDQGHLKGDSKLNFKEFAIDSCGHDFFVKSLDLKSDEIPLFIQFCEADPKSIIVAQSEDILALMDFLFLKSEEYKSIQENKKQVPKGN